MTRVLMHETNHSSLVEIQTQWSCEDVITANFMIDFKEDLTALAHAEARRRAKAAQ